jgi:hypothetical protein
MNVSAKIKNCVAFEGDSCIAEGEFACVTLAIRKAMSRQSMARQSGKPILTFDAATGEQIDVDLRISADVSSVCEPVAMPAETPRGPGRPKLGVVAREVTLLPRHWEWLASQPGGASVAIRKLVEHAMRANAGKDRVRASQNAAYRFMSVMAGDRPGFEEAARALFAADQPKFHSLVDAWPKDIAAHIKKLAADALASEKSAA